MIYDSIIIGGGPAGLSAALYLARAFINLIVLEKEQLGGLLLNACLVENYLGFPQGISGLKLSGLFVDQINTWKIKITMEEALSLTKEDDIFIIKSNKKTRSARTVILACGTKEIIPAINGLETISPKHLFFEIKNIPINLTRRYLIIGGGDAAFDYALSLANQRCSVDIFVRGNILKCLDLLKKRVMQNKRIRVIYETEIKKICYEKNLKKILLQDINNKTYQGDYLIVACGRKENNIQTNVNNSLGLFYAGDLVNGHYRQVAKAVGDGVYKAMQVVEFINNESN